MATTYTSPFGLTNQGQATDSLTSALSTITGKVPQTSTEALSAAMALQAGQPQFQAAERSRLGQQYQIPQSTDYAAKIVDMYMHDKNLNQQFQGNPAGSPVTTMPGTDVVSAVPRLTPENLNQPFSGFTDPVMASQASAQAQKGLTGTLSNLGELIKANLGTLDKQYSADTEAYKSAIDFYKDTYKTLLSTGLTQKDIIELGLKGAEIGMKYDPEKGWVQDELAKNSVSDVIKQGGDFILKKASGQKERLQLAKDIMASGGVNEYRKMMPLEDLITTQEAKGLQDQTDLLMNIDEAIPLFKNDVLGGTGPMAQFLPGFVVGQLTRDKRAKVEKIRSAYQLMISGKVVSEKEAQRLEKFLPTSSKTEKQNSEDLERLKSEIERAQTVFESSKKNGLTYDQAYREYQKGLGTSNQDTTPGKSYTVGDFTVTVEE